MKNECAIFPVQQIISTSIGAMCTALLMVERIENMLIEGYSSFSRRHSMLFEYDCNLNNINTLKVIVLSFEMDLVIICVHVSMDMNQSLGTIDRFLDDTLARSMHC